MNIEEAYEAGASAAAAGQTLSARSFPPQDELFRAWMKGFREHQVFDPRCSGCHGCGLTVADPEGVGHYSSAMLACECNIGGQRE
jgi:hypothetical protein